MDADSATETVEEVEVEVEVEVEEGSINMDDAVESIGTDLFGKSEEPEDLDEALKKELAEEPEEPEEEKKVEKKETQDVWESMSKSQQEQVLKREEQMRSGLDKDRTDANLGRTMRDIMTPHAALLKEQGVDEPTAVKYMLNAHYKLSTGSPEQRKAAFQEMAKSYGLSDATTTPEINDVVQRIQKIETNLTASQQRAAQAMRTEIESTVETFAKDHPHFDDLQDDIAKFITAGYELEDAYEKAVWASPATRQLMIDQQHQEKTDKSSEAKKAEADKAKKAKSVNVRGRDTRKAPTGPTGTMEDTMRETMREIKSRN